MEHVKVHVRRRAPPPPAATPRTRSRHQQLGGTATAETTIHTWPAGLTSPRQPLAEYVPGLGYPRPSGKPGSRGRLWAPGFRSPGQRARRLGPVPVQVYLAAAGPGARVGAWGRGRPTPPPTPGEIRLEQRRQPGPRLPSLWLARGAAAPGRHQAALAAPRHAHTSSSSPKGRRRTSVPHSYDFARRQAAGSARHRHAPPSGRRQRGDGDVGLREAPPFRTATGPKDPQAGGRGTGRRA